MTPPRERDGERWLPKLGVDPSEYGVNSSPPGSARRKKRSATVLVDDAETSLAKRAKSDASDSNQSPKTPKKRDAPTTDESPPQTNGPVPAAQAPIDYEAIWSQIGDIRDAELEEFIPSAPPQEAVGPPPAAPSPPGTTTTKLGSRKEELITTTATLSKRSKKKKSKAQKKAERAAALAAHERGEGLGHQRSKSPAPESSSREQTSTQQSNSEENQATVSEGQQEEPAPVAQPKLGKGVVAVTRGKREPPTPFPNYAPVSDHAIAEDDPELTKYKAWLIFEAEPCSEEWKFFSLADVITINGDISKKKFKATSYRMQEDKIKHRRSAVEKLFLWYERGPIRKDKKLPSQARYITLIMGAPIGPQSEPTRWGEKIAEFRRIINTMMKGSFIVIKTEIPVCRFTAIGVFHNYMLHLQ
ncbi:hypothetical protein K458DRAFT_388587 [Lentithecium fluviatile CBS 122367]|uniref:Uncharacterized protein n=1 Tax=Lentithecium fluviatile CBS 122367 TaxID=1168545 RepID=A0A6G1J3U6_9PLEO|nr:hypothetical protein K458DRAFT_388587 [Lentithecium fluviatile CBS 122367]